jgi:hypothetical protein
MEKTQLRGRLETDMNSYCGEPTKKSAREVNRSVTSDEMQGVTSKVRR